MAPGAAFEEEIKTPRSPRKLPPYPYYDLDGDYEEELPVPRVKYEGEQTLVKSRGTVDKWAFHAGNCPASPRPEPRCPTRESVSNWTHGKMGTIKPVIDGVATPRPETAPPRIKMEGEDIARLSQGGRMSRLLTKYGETGPTPRVARVKPEAEGTAEVSKGKRMNRLIHSYGALGLSPRGVPRVKMEGEDNADLDKGKRMNGLIHSYGALPRSARAVPRVKSEAGDNAELDKGKRMKNLLHKYGRMPLSARAIPRVKTEAEGNATLDRGGRMERLMHRSETLPLSARNPPRVKNVEAKNTYHRGRGSMGKVLREMGNRTCIFKPGVKKSSYLKTSMM